MANKRMVRVNELIKRVLADELYHVFGGGGFDLASVSITRVKVSPDLRDAYVYVSILGHEGEREHILEILTDNRARFQRDLAKNVKLRYTPKLEFRLDESVEQGDHVLGLIAEMERDGLVPDE